jgi:hypothetical protein
MFSARRADQSTQLAWVPLAKLNPSSDRSMQTNLGRRHQNIGAAGAAAKRPSVVPPRSQRRGDPHLTWLAQQAA